VGSESFEATALRGLGVVVAQRGMVDVGLVHLARARSIAERLGEDDQVAETDAATGFAHLAAGRTDEAVTLAEQAAAACERADADYLLPFVLRVWGAALGEAGRVDEARACLRRALHEASDADVERGFILAELASLTPDADERDVLRAQAREAWQTLGFVGTTRYPLDERGIAT